jgi:hypothetical protein
MYLVVFVTWHKNGEEMVWNVEIKWQYNMAKIW